LADAVRMVDEGLIRVGAQDVADGRAVRN